MIVTSNPVRKTLPSLMERCVREDIPIIAIVIETTGLDYQSDGLLQIGAIKYSVDDNGLLTETACSCLNRYVQYEKPIPDRITALNGITNQMVANADRVEVALQKLSSFCGEKFVALLYNATFVTSWLKWGHIMYGVPFEPIGTIDVYRMALDVHGAEAKNLKLRFVTEEILEATGTVISGHFNDAPHDARCIAAAFNYFSKPFKDMLSRFPAGTQRPQIIRIRKRNQCIKEPIWIITCRFYGEIVFDSYAGTFSNEYDVFELLDVNALEEEVLKYFGKFRLKDIK